MEASPTVDYPEMATETETRPIILASRSPRRAALLRQAGIVFEAVPPKHDEPDTARWRFSPEEFAQSASYFKARSVADDHPDCLILAADTVVSLGGKLFGKPTDENDARRILATLSGTTHRVITGVTLYEPATNRRLIGHAVTQVTMRPMSDEELSAYLATGEWQGKAGAYGIQDRADAFVERTAGSFSNVVGLPIELLADMLAALEIRPEKQ